ncbi:MAG: hypothetical protein OEZ58_14920 [Gammaproteobacteria bacterium]|nr:hypothetical protein [Gammaproteobacteria bacterium]MDH5730287.1 hypothetical protein [Gammaproteobacteria bacterium]
MSINLAKDFLKEEPEKLRTIEFSKAFLTIWQGKSLPTRKVAIVSGKSFDDFVANENIGSFQRALKILSPSLDSDKFLDVFRELTPLLRIPIVKKLPYLAKYSDKVFLPKSESEKIDFCVENLTDGLIEHVSIKKSDYSVTIEVIGKGEKFGLL